MQDWTVAALVAALVAVVVVVLVLALALGRVRRRTRQELEAARSETASLQTQLDDLERRLSQPTPTSTTADAEFLITDLGRAEPEPLETPQIGGALFADLVLRETVVKAASLAHGVRRALDPETRHRIRFEMRREVKRSRKQRRVDTRQARREWAARQRATLDEGPAQDPAA